MMWDNFGMHGDWWTGIGLIHMLLVWGLIILAIIALVKWLSGKSSGTGPAEKTSVQILQERYARGEIDKEEYEQKKADLER
jgi:putative membrane protein